MALYLGNDKVKINLNGIMYHLNLYNTTPIKNGIRLLSSDGYVLTDNMCVYLSVKSLYTLHSYDNYLLKDSDGLYLISKESE